MECATRASIGALRRMLSAPRRAWCRCCGTNNCPIFGDSDSTHTGRAGSKPRSAAARRLSKLRGVQLDDGERARLARADDDAAAAGAAPAAPPTEARGGGARAPARVLDLDALAFARGAHQMTNRRCELPPKSWRAQKKGYEEVHVPAAVNTEASKIPLVPVDALPAWTRPAFAGMRTLNTVQSKLLPAALRSSQNLLLCAPTGAGKTNVAVLALLSCLAAYRQNAEDDALCRVDLDAFKIV